jgi:hypothetical protein
MAGLAPEPDDENEPTSAEDDFDVRFAEITARLGDLTVPPADPNHDRSSDQAVEPPRPTPVAPGPRDYELHRETGSDDDDGPGFEPDPPPALLSSDPILASAWTGVVVPIALVLMYLILWRGMPTLLLGLAGVSFVVSVGVLVWRMPHRRDADDHDDGAVV